MGNEKKQAERLWRILTGHDPDAQNHDADEVAESLARFGQPAAAVVLRDVRAAVGFANDHFEDDDDQDRNSLIAELEDENDWYETAEESDLSWREPWLDEDQLGGAVNVFRIRLMLEEIGGPTARRALSLLSLADGPLTTVSPTNISALAALLTEGDPETAVTAAYALGRIGPDAVDPLLAVLSPAAPVSDQWVERGRTFQTVRSAAARALGRIGDRRALDALVGAIGTYDPWTSGAAVRAVIALGGDPRAVLPTLKAELRKDRGGEVWDSWDRIEAAVRMGPRTFEALMEATKNRDSLIRSLALRGLVETTAAKDEGASQGAGAEERWERAAWRAVVGRDDPSPSVRLSAIRLLHHLKVPGLSELLVPLLDDEGTDEHGIADDNRPVGEDAAEALPDDAAALEGLRRALEGGQLNAAAAWKSFVDWNGDTEQVRGSVRHGEVLAPFILEAARRGDADAVHALRYAATTRALERLGGAYLDESQQVCEAADERELEEEQARKRAQAERDRPSAEQLRAEQECLRAEAQRLRAEQKAREPEREAREAVLRRAQYERERRRQMAAVFKPGPMGQSAFKDEEMRDRYELARLEVERKLDGLAVERLLAEAGPDRNKAWRLRDEVKRLQAEAERLRAAEALLNERLNRDQAERDEG